MAYHDDVKHYFEKSDTDERIEYQKSDAPNLASGSFMEKWPVGIRWVLFLPAAILTAFLAQAVFYLLQTSFEGIQEGSLFHGLINLARTAIMFGVFVYVGAFVAPRHQFVVSIILLVLATIFASLILWSVLLLRGSTGYQGVDQLYYLLHILIGLTASGIVVYNIKEELE